jgi:hypothetical protein
MTVISRGDYYVTNTVIIRVVLTDHLIYNKNKRLLARMAKLIID